MTPEILLSHNQMFNETPLNIEDYLYGIDRNTLIKIALLFIYNEGNFKDLHNFCPLFFHRDNYDFVYLINKSYKTIITQNDKVNCIEKKYIIISEHTGLELMKQTFSLPASTQIKSHTQTEQDIFHAILIINETITEITVKPDDETEINMFYAATYFCNQLSYYDFSNISLEQKIFCQFTKAIDFFSFCDTSDNFKNILPLFLNHNKCDSWKLFLEKLLRLMMIAYKTTNEEGYPLLVIEDEDKNQLDDIEFLTSLSIDLNITIPTDDNSDYKVFRSFPLIKISNNEFYIINKSFSIEKLYNSIIFDFKKINEQLPKKERIRDVFSEYTSKFSEEYLFYKVINKICENKKYIKLSGKDCKIRYPKIDAEPDFYIRNGNKIFLFESKDLKFNADIKICHDYTEIKNHITSKLIVKDDGTKVGIHQLIKNICRIDDKNFVWDDKISNARIYPILVIHDPIYSLPGLNYLLNNWFAEELNSKNIHSKVFPLLVIDIDTLNMFSSQLADGRINLENEINNYYKYLSQKKPYLENIFMNMSHIYFSFSYFLNQKFNPIYKTKLLDPYITEFISR